MGAIAHFRAQRSRIAGYVIVALLIFGGVAAGHHHRLVGPSDSLALSAPHAAEPMGRSTECVVCRAAHAARIVIAEVAVPQTLLLSILTSASTESAIPATFRPSSPRAPPIAV
ncbi:MAG TPA: hypothetical protein VGQ76_27810 [Thermoanaerobaculia bacterium]|jgi:hypothetical protein|nr:hypothetical protein [Thermoanaerobaculia bacterium]